MRFLFVLLFPLVLGAQAPAEWSWAGSSASNELKFKVNLQEGWHVYSQYIQNDIGPVPTSFAFEELSGIQLLDSVTEPVPIKKYDENFEATLDFFEGEVVFTQKYSGVPKGPVSGTITYMLCNDRMCLPPVDLHFLISIQ
ncbi:MAG: hypothetical protein RIT43_55 [Bacteroidota bacterium]|jgi:thiol:disulfide interchange protein DsbD